MEDKKNIEIVPGDGTNLNISPVYDHLSAGKPKSTNDKPTNIVIPKVTHKQEKKKNNNNDDDEKENDNKDNKK